MRQSGDGQLKGTVERIVFSNTETQFHVGILDSDEGFGAVTFAGNFESLQPGESVELEGSWEKHPKFGPQFKVQSYRSVAPVTEKGIRKYLGSGLVPGIGKTYANKIVDTFGGNTLEIIENDSGRLREVPGIGSKRAKDIKAAWDTQRATREVLLFLQSYGVTTGNCLRIVRRYGRGALEVVRNDPYLMAREVDGIGFRTADQIARKLGFEPESETRLTAGLLHQLKEMEGEGNTACEEGELLERTGTLLGVDSSLLQPCIEKLVHERHLECLELREGRLLQTSYQSRAEEKIQLHLQRILDAPANLPPIKIGKAIEWAERRCSFTLAAAQREALDTALRHRVAILTGGPGTGKTTILRCLVDILKAKKVRIILASPTGRAAKRLSDSARHRATTIHRLLRFDPQAGGVTVNEEHPLNGDFIIIDEVSMLDNLLASALLRSIPSGASALFVGDADQLPSVGAGNFLGDLVESGRFPVVRLQKVFRQSEASGILTTAYSVLEGRVHLPPTAREAASLNPNLDIEFLPAHSPGQVQEILKQLLGKWLRGSGFDFIRDVQVLSPMHRGEVGIRQLNRFLQDLLNSNTETVVFGERNFRKGDRVIQLRNNYEKGIFNGDMGIVSHLNPEAGTLAADFEGTVVDFERMELADLDLAYAISIHKSQGSEFPVVILPLMRQHAILLQRNLLYTAITRGRNKVILLGEGAAFAMAVRTQFQRNRTTGLPLRLAR